VFELRKVAQTCAGKAAEEIFAHGSTVGTTIAMRASCCAVNKLSATGVDIYNARVRRAVTNYEPTSSMDQMMQKFKTFCGEHVRPIKDNVNSFQTVRKNGGLPDLRFHYLQHKAATRLVRFTCHYRKLGECSDTHSRRQRIAT